MPSLSSSARREPLHALLDQECRYATRPGLRVGFGVDDQRVGVGTVGDPHLAAVEHVPVLMALCAQAHRHDVRSSAWLAHRQRTDMLPGDQLRQVFPFLRGVAVAANLIDAKVRVRPVERPTEPDARLISSIATM